MPRGPHVDDAVERRGDVGIGEPHVGLGPLRADRLELMLRRGDGAPPDAHLLGVRACDLQRRTLAFGLARQRIQPGARRIEGRARLIELLRRCQPRLGQLLRSLVSHAGVLEIRLGGRPLRIGRGDRRLALPDLLAQLPLLKTQRRLALTHLRGQAFGAVLVVGAIRLQLRGRDHREQLPARHRVALGDLQLGDLTGDLRADDDVVGGDDAGEDERRRWQVGIPVPAAAGEGGNGEEREESPDHDL